MRDGHLRGTPSGSATQRQMDVLAAYVAAGGSVSDAARLVGIRPSTVKRHLADMQARSGLSTEQLIYRGRAEGWLVVPSLESDRDHPFPRHALGTRLQPHPPRGSSSQW
jgi:DNA-binding CsgD family transcriptional regulator